MHFGRRTTSVLALAAILTAIPAVAQKPPEPANPEFDRLAKAATGARIENRSEQAIGFYRQALALRATWTEGWWFLGELLYDDNQYAEARDSLRRLIALDRNSGPGFALLSLCEFETKEYDKSLNHIYQARRIGLG